MTDVFDRKTRSRIMSHIRSKNTKAEMILRRALYARGLRGYSIHAKILGSPDVLFSRSKIAVFIDGDFWHGYDWAKRRKTLPKTYWKGKISKNIARDAYVTKRLSGEGWLVLRFWEHDVLQDADGCSKKVLEAVNRTSS